MPLEDQAIADAIDEMLGSGGIAWRQQSGRAVNL
jgi:hypothetical protein